LQLAYLAGGNGMFARLVARVGDILASEAPLAMTGAGSIFVAIAGAWCGDGRRRDLKHERDNGGEPENLRKHGGGPPFPKHSVRQNPSGRYAKLTPSPTSHARRADQALHRSVQRRINAGDGRRV